MRGCVFPAGFLPPHGFAVGVQPHEHVLLLVAPLRRGVGVVLVLLDAFDQAAVWTKVPLRGEEEETKVSERAINIRASQLQVDFHVLFWRYETKILFDGCWIKKCLCVCNQTPPHPHPTTSTTPVYLVSRRASDVMGIQFQAVQQNASLSFLPCVISSVV